jgi:hypothetical protein
VLGVSLLMLSGPSSVASFGGLSGALPARAQSVDGALVQKVRYRGRRHHGGHRRGHYRGHCGGSDAGAVAAGAIIGMALGAIVASRAVRHNRRVEWCIRRCRS